MIKDSEFMDSVMMELLDNYNKNSDELNIIEYDIELLQPMLDKAIELEWYEICARIHKQINSNENVTTEK